MKRREAKAQGFDKYNTGKPCRNGHMADRYTGSGDCVECKRMKNLANKEQTKLATRKYREKLKK